MIGGRASLDLRDPERVKHCGHDHGGPLELHHRAGCFIVIKWPSYTQWAGRGVRGANKVVYYLYKILQEPLKGEFWHVCELRREIEPGRKRQPVKDMMAEADRLAAE